MPSEGVPKCQRCRRDHKRCSPEVRAWPGQRCERCENYGYECSENMMARRSAQRDRESAPTISRPFEGRPGNYQQGVTRPLLTRPISLTETESIQSPFVGLFLYLKNIDWQTLSCPSAEFGSDPFAAMFQSHTCFPNLFNPPLGRRGMYLEIFAESERLKQSPPSPPVPYGHSLENSVVTAIVHRVQREQHRKAMNYSFEELSRRCSNYIRYGSYWNRLRTMLNTDEVLLIDPEYSFDKPNPDTTFETAVYFWLFGIPGLKELCQKLSGLSHMILCLARTPHDDPVRNVLATQILNRLNEVLGSEVASLPQPSQPRYSINSNNSSHDNGHSYVAAATIGSSTVGLRDAEPEDPFSSDSVALQAGFGVGYVYQGAWNN
ncbi:hypothetical protein, variant 2 [Blastomyces gilchristii SLH14081]|uniref:Zn(2)-C6 fungal-type domain-containing protein n=1 Tax=Blastomyces gilchristii (strain SLH14081) TaxID=559298 RepID=A0A179ULW0_BLAGS|nr:hypothetical protein, variant 1 [Blastomyces gilchristii SLH14081]XP_031578472.1 uncharacterized protein BDBG_05021 [Blastomyces gilchristii SLH14081]XP_031578473.1 hypothetical protein, variant 2 [Blastomyces gilchristii SLH14081]OAT08792.1 hypothetical protein BDBG_05021 [Blastomyces gilchristii SLH14081]OAT08793.1 hypothetical protein, variant 1 [Blastomyces gilchristii SLH14081]OAT08794.1 hypothetical protein, variant 2 [Blastomyces gilchristii SLH14081]